MSQRVINQIKEQTGESPVDTHYSLNDIKRVVFRSDADYEAIAEAAASVDAETGSRILIWGCGLSDEGHPVVGIQLFETVDPSDIDTSVIDDGDYGVTSSGVASTQTYTSGPGE
jgi:hypothetical protein